MQLLANLKNAIRRRGRVRIETYRSYGPTDAVRFSGRVVANPVLRPALGPERRSRTAARMVRRFLTREISGAAVTVTHQGQVVHATTDNEGYFEAYLQVEPALSGWVTAMCTLDGSGDEWIARSIVLDDRTGRLVISDIDDTVLHNAAGDTFRTIAATVMGSVFTRRPVESAPGVYRRVVSAGADLVYVSSSPWNLHGFLSAFLDRNRFPSGPMILRDFGFNRATLGSGHHGSHKTTAIESMLQLCPNARVVLIGDTSQQDPAAFAAVANDHPGQVIAVVLRDVGDPLRAATANDLGATITDPGTIFAVIQDMKQIIDLLEATDWFTT